MSMPLLATKLHIPPSRPNLVPRPRLIERLNEGMQRRLTLISAPAGFGKTTLLGEWLAGCERSAAWLSLDAGDRDPARFVAYLIAALQSVAPHIGAGVADRLQSPQPLPTQAILATLLNDITRASDHFTLVLDDYHLIDGGAVEPALTFLLDHLPPQLHLVIATRTQPSLPVARLRARGHLIELRAADLRFTPLEAASFLTQGMRLNLSSADIAALETRTEGWIAGLQLAAISIQGKSDPKQFIASFRGSHRYVLDYLIEEVLERQPERVQSFLLQTAILERLNGSLCDALTGQSDGQATLEYLEDANLFLVPLDDERQWYRYHQLFADFLGQRLRHGAASSSGIAGPGVAELHRRASAWHEDQGLELEAFRHAAAANDIERARRLMEGNGLPLYFRGALTPVMQWLESLPAAVLDARPSLWVAYASTLTMLGQPVAGVEAKLQAAEAALQDAQMDETARDLLGHIAAMRAMLAIPQNQVETLIAQSRRALDYLRPDNAPLRTSATWTLGYAYQVQGNRAAATRAYTEVIANSQTSGSAMMALAATTLLGQVRESDTQLALAAESYRRALDLAGDPPWPAACEAYLGLARLSYEWNDLESARSHAEQSLQLASQLETVDTPAACQVVLAQLTLAMGDVDGAAALVSQAEQFMRQNAFVSRMPEVVATQVLILLRQGRLAAAARLAEHHKLPLSRARVKLAQDDPAAALAILRHCHDQAEARGWHDQRLKALVLQALGQHMQGEAARALRSLLDALGIAEAGGFVRTFVDEGPPMRALLQQAAQDAHAAAAVRRVQAAFGQAEGRQPAAQPLLEPLSEREREVLRLLATELSGPEIARELLVSLNTMRTHTKNIYAKLGVNTRRAAVRVARDLALV
jgi:LuxR family maltose regulon positive regulatory protein